MNMYVLTVVVVLLFTAVGSICYAGSTLTRRSFSDSPVYFVVILLFLSLLMGLRGDFTVDYPAYVRIFNSSAGMTLSEVLTQKEPLYRMIGYAVSKFAGDETVNFVVVAAVMTFAYLKFMKQWSPIMWLSVVMMVSVGSFWTSANLVRNILAAALYSLTWKFVAEKDLKKYIISMLVIGLIHTSALIVAPVYFFLGLKWKKKYIIPTLILVVGIFAGISFFARQITNIAMNFLYSQYLNDGYGVDFSISMIGLSKVFLVQIFIFMNIRKINFENSGESCLFSASLLYLFLSLCCMRVAILQRFSYYFASSHLVLVPIIVSRFRTQKQRIAMCGAGCILLILYTVVSTYGDVFYFYWEK